MARLTESEFREIVSFVKVNYGIDLGNRRNFVEMRVGRLMDATGFDSFSEYFGSICADITGVQVSDFINHLTVNYTLFYREHIHFDYLRSVVLPWMVEKEQVGHDLRMWSAGCASGEEPYTIAMVIADYLGLNRPLWDAKILATDISTVALKKAVAAEYPAGSVDGLNPSWIKRYFVMDPQKKDIVTIASDIRSEVIFRKLNLVGSPFQFKRKFHFIFCRNVMIYFDEETKNRLLNRLYDVLEDGGYLFIGLSETIEKNATRFEYVMPSVYRKGGRL